MRALLPFLLVILMGIAGTGLYKVSEGVIGSPYVNQPGSISLIDEGEQLEWSHRVQLGQIPYRDFWTPYTPLRLYLLNIFYKLLGTSVLTERIYFAFLPLIGFSFFYLLLKRLTKNTFLSLLFTAGAIAGQAIEERNALVFVFIYFFVRKNFFLAGIFTSLTFLMSQEFGIYVFIAGVIFHRSKKYFLGIFSILLPFLIYLLINQALLPFYQNVFADFLNGGISKLWVEPFYSFFLPPPNQIFDQGGYLFQPRIQAYLLIAFLAISLLLALIKFREWLFFSILGILFLRGLFFSQTVWRIASILPFFYLLLGLITQKILKKKANFFVILVVIFLNWYALSLSNINLFLNNLAEFVIFSHVPQGIYLDAPRFNINFYPTRLDDLRQSYLKIKTLPKDAKLPAEKDFDRLGEVLFSLKPSYSSIIKKDPKFVDELARYQEIRSRIISNLEPSPLTLNDAEWFSKQKQLKDSNYQNTAVNILKNFLSDEKANLSLDYFQSELRNFSYHLDLVEHLKKNKGQYAFGFPLPSLAMFLANKINVEKYSPTLTNIPLSAQKETINALNNLKICYGIRLNNFEDKSLKIEQYAPLLWQYTKENYDVESSLAGVDLLILKSCKK